MRAVAGALAVLGCVLAAGAGPAGASTTACPAPVVVTGVATVTCAYTGDEQTFTVPAGVTSITIHASGAQGGSGFNGGGAGANGGSVTATITVTPGESLAIFVGGQGGNGGRNSAGAAGFNGGGVGTSAFLSGGGGGGASDVRQGGNALANRVVVAGGGGGGGGAGGGGAGGAGGSTTGAAGATGAGGGSGGGGGTQAAGGAAGAAGTGASTAATAGTSGTGGNGGATLGGAGGGGGGAGYFGGGGGGGDQVSASGGGGGSSFTAAGATGVSHTQGVRSGHGLVTITYTTTTLSEQLAALLTAVTGVGPGKSLANKVEQIQGYLAGNDTASACNLLNDFISEVKAQKGKKLTDTLADSLTAQANAIKATLGC